VASVLMLQFEGRSRDANIVTGGDSLWWAVVTITTVGYGDYYPTTALGRLTAVFVMFAGVGIIGALASILASILVPPPEPTEASSEDASATAATPTPDAPALGQVGDVAAELAAIRAELAALRSALPDRSD
jgi:voltage-gated potassium channel